VKRDNVIHIDDGIASHRETRDLITHLEAAPPPSTAPRIPRGPRQSDRGAGDRRIDPPRHPQVGARACGDKQSLTPRRDGAIRTTAAPPPGGTVISLHAYRRHSAAVAAALIVAAAMGAAWWFA
jgi:hypothetical protein